MWRGGGLENGGLLYGAGGKLSTNLVDSQTGFSLNEFVAIYIVNLNIVKK
jgi:hypothetical protein